jgi:hypothetical protein
VLLTVMVKQLIYFHVENVEELYSGVADRKIIGMRKSTWSSRRLSRDDAVLLFLNWASLKTLELSSTVLDSDVR